jgi:flavin-dependent dehydrogenase
MRRPLLHQLLLDRATALGVRFSWQTVVQGIQVQGIQVQGIQAQGIRPGQGTARSVVRTNRHTIRPRYIIGADGHQSRIRGWASLDRASISARRIGLRQHFTLNPLTDLQSDLVEVYWSNNGQAYVTPISPTEICVAFVARRKFPDIEHALNQFPQLQQRLQSATPSNTPRGAVTFSRKLHRVTRGNVALIGDASGSVDAVTGEGLGLCFRQAIALGEALSTGDLAHYQREHIRLRRMPHFMAQTMLLLDESPRLRTGALKALERRPQIFQQLLRVHIGHAPVTLLGPTGLLAAGVRILAG